MRNWLSYNFCLRPILVWLTCELHFKLSTAIGAFDVGTSDDSSLAGADTGDSTAKWAGRSIVCKLPGNSLLSSNQGGLACADGAVVVARLAGLHRSVSSNISLPTGFDVAVKTAISFGSFKQLLDRSEGVRSDALIERWSFSRRRKTSPGRV